MAYKKIPGFPVASLDHQTKLILNHCMNPDVPGAWDVWDGSRTRAKRENSKLCGVINRALDAGYKGDNCVGRSPQRIERANSRSH